MDLVSRFYGSQLSMFKGVQYIAENKQATSSNEFHRLGIPATDHVDFYYAALQEERDESGIKSLT